MHGWKSCNNPVSGKCGGRPEFTYMTMKPDRTRRIGFKISLALHLLALAAALAISWASFIPREPKPAETMTFVQIPVSVRTAPLPDTSVPEPTIAEPPESDPVPEPAKESIRKEETKKIEPVKKPKTVEKQTNRVTKTKASVEPAKPPEPPSEERIRTLLTADIPMGDPGVLGVGESNPLLAGYYSQVFSRMYAAWNQPAQIKTLPGLKTEVRIVVEPGGKIVERVKSQGSGNELMDDSVMMAVRSVKELPPLPIGYRKPIEITVTFVLGS